MKETSKIQIMSRVIQILFLLMLIFSPLLYLLYSTPIGTKIFALFGWSMSVVTQENWVSLINPNSHDFMRFAPFIISWIPIITFMFLYFYLARLFGLYAKNIIFSMDNVRYIRNCGITLLLWQIIHPIYQILISYALSYNNLPGHRYIHVSFGTSEASDLVIAIVIIVISWIMRRGVELENEHQLTV